MAPEPRWYHCRYGPGEGFTVEAFALGDASARDDAVGGVAVGDVSVGDGVVADDVGELAGVDGPGVTLADGRGEGGNTVRVFVREKDVVGLSDAQVPRCLRAIHPGAPFAIASSGQVSWYIETLRTARQRPSRNATQYGSPEYSLAITAHPPPQSITREPLSG